MAQPTRKTDHKKPAITQEQRDEYNRRRRETYRRRKDERRHEIESNTFTERRLHFVRVIMHERGLTQAKLAQRLGETRQAVSAIFAVNDDAKLSMVKRMLGVCDCTCAIEIIPLETHRREQKATYEFKGNFKPTGLKWDSAPAVFVKYPAAIENCPPDANLRFLADFIITTNLSVTEFSEKVKISRQNIAYAFSIDDIRLSTLCQIANLLNARIVWSIESLETNEGQIK